MSTMKIQVQLKTHYATDYLYPACGNARAFCIIANKKTLTNKIITQIKKLGFEIEIIAPNLSDLKTL